MDYKLESEKINRERARLPKGSRVFVNDREKKLFDRPATVEKIEELGTPETPLHSIRFGIRFDTYPETVPAGMYKDAILYYPARYLTKLTNKGA